MSELERTGMALRHSLLAMDVEAEIARLGEAFTRMLREYGGTIPDAQLIEEIGLAIAIHRRHR